MDTILLVCGNDENVISSQAYKHHDQIYKTLESHRDTFDLRTYELMQPTHQSLEQQIQELKNTLTFFVYTSTGLEKKDDRLLPRIIQLLEEAPKLELVLLSGDTTKKQVDHLLEIGVPIVMFYPTENRKLDPSSSMNAFFQKLTEGASIREAFDHHRIQEEHSSEIFYKRENQHYLNKRLTKFDLFVSPSEREIEVKEIREVKIKGDKKASSSRPKPKPKEKNYPFPASVNEYVDCSVYAPKKANTGNDIMIQAWLHLKKMAEEVERRAKEVDDTASRRASKTLSIAIKKGDQLSLQLVSRDALEIDEPTQHLIWSDEPIQSLDFIVALPESFTKNKTFFVLHVFKQEIPIGQIKFFVGMDTAPITGKARPAVTRAKQYEKAFISYASANRDEVLKRVQMLAQLDIPFFQDILDLKPGEHWEEELYTNIDACDVFFLFWSKAAKESKWVLKELQYAIKRKKGDDDNPPYIKPVPLERPMVKPPKELGHMHFNDQILYFMVNV